MKKLYILFLLTFGGGIINAQITLTNSDMPVIGTSFLYAQDTTRTTSPGSSGANQSWDLSTLKNQSIDTVAVLSASGTPAASKFPMSSFVFSASNAYTAHTKQWTYYYITANALELLGFYQSGNSTSYSPPETGLLLPSTYNSTFTIDPVNSLVFSYPVPPYDSLKIQSTGHLVSLVDGYGSLTTPSKTYPNTLRIKNKNNSIDSTFRRNKISGIWTLKSVGSGVDSSYNWYANGIGNAVAQINAGYGSYLLSSPVTGINTSSSNNNMLEIAPNPFNKQTSVSLQLNAKAKVQMILYNALGQTVSNVENANLESGNYKYDINVSDKGIYFLRIAIDGVSSTRKLIQIEQ
jgi:hypothetical protein